MLRCEKERGGEDEMFAVVESWIEEGCKRRVLRVKTLKQV